MRRPTGLVVALVLVCLGTATAHAAPLFDGGARRLATKLTFDVRSADPREGALSYAFVATILKVAPTVQYEWYTTSPVAADGIRELGPQALATATTLCQCHADREWGEEGDGTSLWLSRSVFDRLRSGRAALAFNEAGGRTVVPRELILERTESFPLTIDGVAAALPALVARTESGTRLWILDDPDDPLVLAIEGAWSFRLRSIFQRRDDEIGRFVLADGFGMHVVERGQGPPLLVLHGGPGMESNYFRPYLEPLERDFRVVYVDQPGHGLSERFPPGRPYTMAGAVAAVDQLREALGFERIALLGHSYGGFIAQLYAQMYPSRLSALVLVDTAPSYAYNAEANANIQRVGTPEQRSIPPGLSNDERIRRVFALYFDPPDRALADAFMDRVVLSAEVWRQLTGSREFRLYDTRPRLASIAVPTLVVVGENDLITTPNQARVIAAAIRGARLEVFPRTGHNPFVEEPARFNELVREFLSGR